MVRLKQTYMFLAVFLAFGITIQAQKHLLAEVRFNKSEIYVGEPVEVRVGIFTSTWFTSPVNPGNIKVNDAFTVYFRSVSTSKQINGQTYAGVELYFNVFPYDDGTIVFPALEFTVETPDKGGYRGVKRVVKTPARTLKVKPVPKSFDRNEWLVTSNMTVSDTWSGNKNQVKVGDVLERRIVRNVAGTVSELIHPIIWDSITNVSMYSKRAEVKNNKTKTAINASRTDGTRYLFEKEGTVVIPQMELTWWNPRAKKLFKRTLKEVTIDVLPNPDLGMLETMRDSLEVAAPIESAGVDEKMPRTILGLSIKQFLIYLILSIVALYIGIKIARASVRRSKRRKEAYRASEAYYFKLFLSALRTQQSKEIINSLYQWINQLKLDQPTIQHFVLNYGDDMLKGDLESIMKSTNEKRDLKLNLHKSYWSKARARFLNESAKNNTKISTSWVNP